MKRILAFTLAITTMVMLGFFVKDFGDKTKDVPLPKKPSEEGGKTPLKEAALTYEQSLAAISEADLKRDLYHLCSDELEGRMSGKRGNVLAASYIKAKFESFGLPAMYHKFNMSRYNPGPKNEVGDDFSQNVYAWIEGTDLKDEVVVVGAHMDHLGYGPKGSQTPNLREIHPGADDNASGTVALLAIAKAMSSRKSDCRRTVVFMAFSGEEMGLIGSQFYVNNPIFPRNSPSMSKHVAMINMDMVGYLKQGEFRAVLRNDSSSVDLDRTIGELSNRYAFAKSITGRSGGGSDHAPFYNKRVPVACLHTGMHQRYHTPNDKPEFINYKGLEQISRYAFELSHRIVSDERRPAFNHGTFVPMQYKHDHERENSPFPYNEPRKGSE
jgi:hypothetical protein